MWKSILILGLGASAADWSQVTPERVLLAAGFIGWAWIAFKRGKDQKISQDLADAVSRITLKDGEIADFKRKETEWQSERSELKQSLGEKSGKLAILEQYDGKAVIEALGQTIGGSMTELKKMLDGHLTKQTEQLGRIELNTASPVTVTERKSTARTRNTD